MTIARTLAALAAGFALSGALAAGAFAQEGNTAPAEPAVEAATASYSEEQLQAFAVAYLQVSEIGMAYDERIQAAQTDEELMGLQAQAQEEMIAAVENVDGLSVDDYNSILIDAQADPELGATIQGYVDAQVQ